MFVRFIIMMLKRGYYRNAITMMVLKVKMMKRRRMRRNVCNWRLNS